MGQAGEPFELGQGDPAQVERPLRALGQADDDEAEAVLAGLLVLLDEAALLERRQQARRGRLVQPEPARELGDAGLALALAEGEQEGRRPVDRPDGVAVEDHPARSVQPAAGCDIAPARSGDRSCPCARASRAASSESEKIETTRSTMSPWACASQMNHGSRESGSGIAPRACIPSAIASYSSWSVVGPVAVLGRLDLGEHDPEHARVAGEVVRQAGRVEDLAQAVLDPPAGGVDDVSSAFVSRRIVERLDRGRGGDPVARVRAAVADLVGQDAHDLLAATERGGRIAVAHRLGVGRQVRRDAEELGGAALGEAEPGLDLVEDQQDPELLGQGAHRLVEAGLGHDPLGVAQDGLDDDRGDLLAARSNSAPEGLDACCSGPG